MSEIPVRHNNIPDVREQFVDETRRAIITDLCVSVIRKLNNVEEEHAKQVLFERDIFGEPIDNLLEYGSKIEEQTRLRGIKASMQIARFYSKTDTFIPNKVIVYDPETDPHGEIQEGERALLLVNTNQHYQDKKTIALQTSKGRVRKVQFERPDVFIESFNGTDVSLKGAENVILGGLITPHIGSIESRGIIGVMPEADMGEEALGHTINLTLNTQGNIIQYEGSNVNATHIRCKNYIRLGGKIEYPAVTMRGQQVIIDCAEEFQGEEPDLKNFYIIDRKSATRREQAVTKSLRNELGMISAEESISQEDELQRQFESFSPTASLVSEDRETNTYELTPLQTKSFMNLAVHLGWDIKFWADGGSSVNSIVIIHRKIDQSSHENDELR